MLQDRRPQASRGTAVRRASQSSGRCGRVISAPRSRRASKRAVMIRAGDADTAPLPRSWRAGHSSSGHTKRQMIQKMK